ncbi:MAG: N4-gp56 family major capsid protein [Mycobacterium sp.]
MATTNFTKLTTEQKTVWSRDVWKIARNNSFTFRFAGKGPNSMIQRITELTKSEKGTRAVISLVTDLEGDGVTGDNTLEGNEEELKAYDQVIQIDQLRNANRSEGRMAEQATVIQFREQSKDKLGYWIGDRIDQMAFLTLSGLAYTNTNNGGTRPVLATGRNLADLDFAGDVTAPSANRFYRWDATAGELVAGDTAAVTATDTPSYKMLVRMKAQAKDSYIRGVRGAGNQEMYHVFMSPQGLAALKLDPDFIANVRHAGVRGDKNSLFAGADTYMVDGMLIHEFRHVYTNAAWGAGANVKGQRVLFCGAQALGLADLGSPLWVEDEFDYGNQPAISVSKILGMKKPVFKSQVTDTNEDFGVICIDTAI